MMGQFPMMPSSTFKCFRREEWAGLRSDAHLSLSDDDLAMLRGLYGHLSHTDVAEIFLPLSRFLNLRVKAAQNLRQAQDGFLGRSSSRVPFVIAISGSVAVGKSTFARVLQAVLGRWPDSPRVELVTTDGFLYPNSVLEQRGLMKRKGFPESYDLHSLLKFLSDAKAGERELEVPVYSHLGYDVVEGERQRVVAPEILIFEGLNVLQAPHGAAVIASDFFDLSVYLDADESDIERWYVERFLLLQRTAFQNPLSYFHRFRDLPADEAIELGSSIWREINLVNLRDNILPTRQRADFILRKQANHSVREVWVRQV
jgi:type I pantothenate kinase